MGSLIDEHARRVILDCIHEGDDERALEIFLRETGYVSANEESKIGVIVGLSTSQYVNYYGSSDRGLIHPGTSTMIVARPQASPFRGHRFAVTRSTGQRFTIDDFRIGVRSMFPKAQSLPAEIFSTDISNLGLLEAHGHRGSQGVEIKISEAATRMFGRAMRMDVCQVAMDIAVSVTNVSKEPWPFQGFVLGEHVDEEFNRR